VLAPVYNMPKPADDDKLKLLMQLRNAGVRDRRVLSAMENVPREMFVIHPFADRAYENTALPIECGQTISQPSIVGWMTQALDVNERSRVLEIGTGSGYQTAVLSPLCRMIYSIERHQPLLKQAKERFKLMGLKNINTRSGDGYKGWPEAAPFDRIIVTAAAPEVPAALIEQLSDKHGIMVIPVGGESVGQILLRIVKTSQGIQQEPLMNVRFVPMVAGKPE
jgi:protein-L-isoaspartate(D-aspartate) O-methyltransferase